MVMLPVVIFPGEVQWVWVQCGQCDGGTGGRTSAGEGGCGSGALGHHTILTTLAHTHHQDDQVSHTLTSDDSRVGVIFLYVYSIWEWEGC